MTKKHLPKAVFEAAAVATARIHLATQKAPGDVAGSIWASYAAQCHDPTAIEDITRASEALVEWVAKANLESPQHLLRHLQHFCEKFEDDGRPKKQKLLGGLWFQPDSYDPERVKVFLRKAQVYCAAAQSGLVPLAPEGYR